MKKLTLTVELELTNKDYKKYKVEQLDPFYVDRNNAQDDIVDFSIPRDLLTALKKSNADISSVTLLDSSDPDVIENYDRPTTNYVEGEDY